MNDSFIFYASFAEAIKSVPVEHRLQCYEALTDYALTGEYDDTDVFVRIIMAQAVPQIDANFKRREDGSKGGRPKKNPTGITGKKPMVIETAETKKPMVIENAETKKPNVNDNDNGNVTDNSFFLEKEKIIFEFSLLLLSEGRANATKEARAAYECNEAEGWQCEVHRRDGSVVVKDFSKNKLSRLKGWRRSVQPTIPIADAMLWIKVLKAIKDTAVKNEALIDDFTGFDVQAEGTVLRLDFATQSAWRTLAAELKENQGLRYSIYEVLRTKYPALKQAFFYSKSPY
ncbi:MAG: hypothetical protein IIT93_02720 [Paludibacteraceae bacterium]|nr:hypothetical protein [Paludibacteraceae bacterium]